MAHTLHITQRDCSSLTSDHFVAFDLNKFSSVFTTADFKSISLVDYSGLSVGTAIGISCCDYDYHFLAPGEEKKEIPTRSKHMYATFSIGSHFKEQTSRFRKSDNVIGIAFWHVDGTDGKIILPSSWSIDLKFH